MRINGKLFAAALRSALLHASTDETRVNLACVRLETTDDAHLRIVATDGHRLFLADLPSTAADEGDREGDAVHIDRATALALAKTAAAWDGVSVRIGARDLAGHVVSNVTEQFPPYNIVFPASATIGAPVKGGKPAMPGGANGRYLAEAAESLRDLARALMPRAERGGSRADRSVRATERARIEAAPIVVCTTGGDCDPILLGSPILPRVAILVMPMRGAAGDGTAALRSFAALVKGEGRKARRDTSAAAE